MRLNKLRRNYSANIMAFSHGFCKAHAEILSKLNVPDYISKSKLGVLVLRKSPTNEWFIGVEMTLARLGMYRIYDRMDEVFDGEVYKFCSDGTHMSDIAFVGISIEKLLSSFCRVSESGWEKIVKYVNIFGEGKMNPYGELWDKSADMDLVYKAGYHLGKFHFNNLGNDMVEARPYLKDLLLQLNNIYHTIEDAFDK